MLRERKHKNPIVDVNLFRERNFAAASFMMLALGLVLYGSTVLLPQYLQIVMGYSAQQAGMVLSPGGLVVMVLLPVVGALTPRVDPRLLIGFGFATLSASMFYMTPAPLPGHRLSHRARAARIPVGRPGVPVRADQHPHLRGHPAARRTTRSRASSTWRATWAATSASRSSPRWRRAARSFIRRASPTTPAATITRSPACSTRSPRALQHAGVSSAAAAHRALAVLYRQTIIQATTLAYLDVLHAFALMAALMIPFLWLARGSTGCGARAAGDGTPLTHVFVGRTAALVVFLA